MPRLPRKMARRHRAPKPHPSAPPHAMSATPATRNEGRCEFVPRLPREIKVDEGGCKVVPRLPRKMARRHRAPKLHPSAPPHAMSATPATRKEGRCEFVPRLPREIKVDEGGCKVVPRLPRKMARRHGAPKPHPSAPPHAMSATPATQNDGRCEIVPRLPREIKVDVRLCHACHVKRRWMSGCATPAVCEVSVKLLYYCM